MKGWRSIIFYTILGALGLVTALEAMDIKSFLLPLVCHVPAEAQIIADECTGKLVKAVGVFTMAIATVGGWLRIVTSTAVFKSLKDD